MCMAFALLMCSAVIVLCILTNRFLAISVYLSGTDRICGIAGQMPPFICVRPPDASEG